MILKLFLFFLSIGFFMIALGSGVHLAAVVISYILLFSIIGSFLERGD